MISKEKLLFYLKIFTQKYFKEYGIESYLITA